MQNSLIDPFGRTIDYIRLSVTDRCDFRCLYCMAEEMTFLPRKEVLSLEELYLVAQAFVNLGVKKVRITGGEPLIRNNILGLIDKLGKLSGLQHLVLTTNGSQLEKYADDLYRLGVNRINVSLDSLNEERFKNITRVGQLEKVLAGIDAAQKAGFKNTKINSVILKGRNEDEIIDLVRYAKDQRINISFIEEMPLGNIDHQRCETYMSSDEIKAIIEDQFTLLDSNNNTGGPSKYFQIKGSDSLVGFISPHSHNFCDQCNRVRITVEGRLLLCLGNEHSLDLRRILRSENFSEALLREQIIEAIARKPKSHEFDLNEAPRLVRFMNATGG